MLLDVLNEVFISSARSVINLLDVEDWHELPDSSAPVPELPGEEDEGDEVSEVDNQQDDQ